MSGPLLLLTGPPAAGKNAVGEAVAARLERCAVIDADVLRGMVLTGHRAPWEGDEGSAQHEFGARNACHLAHNFYGAGFGVVVLDVLSDELAHLYRKRLDPWIVQLMPTFEEVRRRNRERPVLEEDEVRWVYERQARFSLLDERVDNTNLPPERVAETLLSRERRP